MEMNETVNGREQVFYTDTQGEEKTAKLKEGDKGRYTLFAC